jgi:hypothetical protein
VSSYDFNELPKSVCAGGFVPWSWLPKDIRYTKKSLSIP